MSKTRLFLAVAVPAALAAGAYYALPMLWDQRAAPGVEQPAASPATPPVLLGTGIVEPVAGEVDVFGQIAGEIEELRVREGDTVETGQVVAVLDARREAAAVAAAEAEAALARAELAHLKAGVGQEERDEARFAVEAVEALARYEQANVTRLRALYKTKAVMLEQLERAEQELEHLTKRAESLRRRHAALERGPIPEEVAAAEARVALAEAQLRMAQVHHRYHEVRAPLSGRVAAVYRHAGDAISLEQLTPILRIIDTDRLRVRVEIDEADVPRIRPGMEGSFHVRGVPQEAGRLVVRTLVPQFGPKRLFTPDASARVDTRVLHVLCDVLDARIALHSGQRITASFPAEGDVAP